MKVYTVFIANFNEFEEDSYLFGIYTDRKLAVIDIEKFQYQTKTTLFENEDYWIDEWETDFSRFVD